MQHVPSRILPEAATKVRRNRLHVASDKYSQSDQGQEKYCFRGSHHDLNRSSGFHSKNIDSGEERHDEYRNRILRVEADFYVADANRPQMKQRNVRQVDEPV